MDEPRIGGQLFFRYEQTIADAEFRAALPGKHIAPIADVDDCVFRRALRLPIEQLGNRRYGVELECLVRVELKFHSSTSHRLEAGYALRLHRLNRVGLELIIADKPFVEANHSFRFAVGHSLDEIVR